MSRLFLGSRADASPAGVRSNVFPLAPRAIGLPSTLGEKGQLIQYQMGQAIMIYLSLAGTGLEYDPPGPTDSEFERQRNAFLAIPKADLLRYAGEFVLSREGQVVDHDRDLIALTGRSGTVPVYITRVGEDFEMGIDTPFLS